MILDVARFASKDQLKLDKSKQEDPTCKVQKPSALVVAAAVARPGLMRDAAEVKVSTSPILRQSRVRDLEIVGLSLCNLKSLKLPSPITMTSLRLRGKVAIVTGSSTGLSRVTALAYAQEGAVLACASL